MPGGGPIDRVLALAGNAGEDVHAPIRDFRRFLLLYGAARSWLWVAASTAGGLDAALLGSAAAAMTAAALLAFSPARAHLAPRLGFAAVLVQVAWRFPFTANHLFLELVCLALLSVVSRGSRREDEALALAGLRWATAIVLFHTGLQKLLYGHYFRGDFLALMIGSQERFARVFAWLLSTDEVARLADLDRKATGAGPYRVQHAGFVLASNAVWLAELFLPALLIVRRTRVWGALGGLALMLSIQVAALELGFALLFVNLLLLFLPGRWGGRLLPATGLLLAYALAAGFGWLPGDPTRWNLL